MAKVKDLVAYLQKIDQELNVRVFIETGPRWNSVTDYVDLDLDDTNLIEVLDNLYLGGYVDE